jgi:hypothetical protein
VQWSPSPAGTGGNAALFSRHIDGLLHLTCGCAQRCRRAAGPGLSLSHIGRPPRRRRTHTNVSQLRVYDKCNTLKYIYIYIYIYNLVLIFSYIVKHIIFLKKLNNFFMHHLLPPTKKVNIRICICIRILYATFEKILEEFKARFLRGYAQPSPGRRHTNQLI